MRSPSDNEQRLRGLIEDVWNRGEADAAARYIAPQYTIHHDPGDPWDGKTLDLPAYQERVRLSRAPFPDQRFTIRELLADERRVFIAWDWLATHQGDLPGFPATGKPIRMSGATVYYIDEGLFSGHWQIADRLGVYGQLRQGLTTPA